MPTKHSIPLPFPTPAALGTVVLFLMLAGPQPAAATQKLPSFEEVRAAHRPSDWLVADHDGVPLQRVRRDDRLRRLGWLPVAQVSPALQAALVTAEDRRFWDHGGVDWAAFARAAWQQLGIERGRNKRGASTLTMQLAGLLDPALHPAAGKRRDYGQKWDQVWAARALEARWTKPQIIEAYLNLVPWRGEAVGLPAAARLWFGKAPEGLDLAEGALLAALLRQPQAPAARVGERACAIVAALPPGMLPATPRPDCTTIKARASLAFAGTAPFLAIDDASRAPHAARRALAEWGERPAPPPAQPGGEPVLRTTLLAPLQQLAADSLRARVSELAPHLVEDGAAVVLDNESGEVLAYVGSSVSPTEVSGVDGVMAQRQAGETLQPFLYALAIEQKRLTAAALLDDSSLPPIAEIGFAAAQNPEQPSKHWVSVRLALAAGLGMPAAHTLQLTGSDAFGGRLRDLGLGADMLPEPPDLSRLSGPYNVSALAPTLAGTEVRLLDLANAYRALANRGRWHPLAALTGKTADLGSSTNSTQSANSTPSTHLPAAVAPGRQVMTATAAFIVGDILADRAARPPSLGLDSVLATKVWSAAKTGTGRDMRDHWCLGYTRRYTVGVWVGNFSGAPMAAISEAQAAAPVWRDVIQALGDGEHDRPPVAPASLLAAEVRFVGVAETPRREWFLRGTETAVVVRADGELADGAPAIAYPAEGQVITLDAGRQAGTDSLMFRMTTEQPDREWHLTRISGGPPCQQALKPPARWVPLPGYWRLELRDAEGVVAGTVRFSVRGSRRHPETCAAEPATGLTRPPRAT